MRIGPIDTPEWMAPVVPAELERQSLSRTLRIIFLALLVAAVATGGRFETSLGRAVFWLVIGALCAALVINHRGVPEWAATIGLLATLSFTAIMAWLARDGFRTVYFLLLACQLLIAALLLRPIPYTAFCALILATVAAVGLKEVRFVAQGGQMPRSPTTYSLIFNVECIFCVGALAGGLLASNLHKNIRKISSELAESTRKEQEIRDLSARLINGQEEERKRLARELHDDLSQQIAALSIATSNLKRQIPEDLAQPRTDSDRIHERLVQLADSVRRMSHELHPAILQHSGLAAALRSHCEEFGTLAGIKVSLDTQGSFENVASAPALCLFRVTQEALRNVAQHARVSEASVELKRAGGILQLTVSDTGVGFPPGCVEGKAGLGLVSIKERARLLGGKVEIRTSPGQGTSVIVQVPELGERLMAV